MDIEVRFFGAESRDKYKIETYYNNVEISRIRDTTVYDSLGGKEIKNTEEITKLTIPIHDLSTLVLSLQKILY